VRQLEARIEDNDLAEIADEAATPEVVDREAVAARQAEDREIDEAIALIKPPHPQTGNHRSGGIVTLPLVPHPELLLTLSFYGPQADADFSVLELFEENGHFYVDYVGHYTYDWKGCPC
jgi:hypothetical protein